MWFLRKFFSLPPIAYIALAPIIALLAIFMYFTDRNSEAEKAAALAGKPPAVVKLEDFDASKHIGKADEVVILAQLDASKMVELTQSKRGRVRNHWTIAPLYPTNAADASKPASGVMVERDPISDDQLSKMAVGAGKFSRILLLNGAAVSRSSESKALSEVEGNMSLAPTALVIDPFEAGRAAGLAPSDGGRSLAIFGLIIALAIGAWGLIRYRTAKNTDRLPDAEAA